MIDEHDLPPDPPEEIPEIDAGARAPVGVGMVIFGFGLAAGFLLAFSGYAVLEENASLVVTVFLAALFVIALVSTIVVFLRRPLMRRLFGVANAQLERFAGPLAEVAEAAVDRDPARATASARDLVRLTLARYAWISTRRWIVASLTGLIAAMAALAGTALLFKQNELLARQSELLAEQNAKIQTQSAYLAQDVQLAEAARNAQLAVEITRIAEALGTSLVGTITGQPKPEPGDWAARIPVLDPLTDISDSLMMRITSASRAVKPYRFLDPKLSAYDDTDTIRVAMQRRRAELPQAYAAMERFYGWSDPSADTALIERPASPERAQLFQTMIRAGIREFELFNWFGLDLSFAWAPDTDLLGISMQNAQMTFAVLDRSQIRKSDFRGARLENAWFRKSVLFEVRFGHLAVEATLGPYKTQGYGVDTFLAGADFGDAILSDVDFSGAHAGAIRFDGAVLAGVDFTDARLGSATFRDAVILNANFTGAGLQSVEFDGALVFSQGFLDGLTAVAAPGTFRADRYELELVDMAAVFEVPTAFANFEAADVIAMTGSERVWRVNRVKPFEDQAE